MKTTTRLITALALAGGIAAFASCQKSELRTETAATSEPVSLTLRVGTATPETPDTKVTYTDNVTTISASWEAGDKISLVQLDTDGKAIKAETFVAKTSGATVDFEGTFTRDANAKSVTVVYPAVDPATWKSGTVYDKELLYVKDTQKDTEYATTYDVAYMTLQSADGVLPNLKDVSLMFCNTADLDALESGSASVSLKWLNYIVKMKVKVAGLSNVRHVQLKYSKSSGYSTGLGQYAWVYWRNLEAGNKTYFLRTFLGTATHTSLSDSTVTGIEPDADGCVTVYMVSLTQKDRKISSTFTLTISAGGVDASATSSTLSYSATPTSDITFSPGYLYTLKEVKELK